MAWTSDNKGKRTGTLLPSIYRYYNFLLNLGESFSVQHCSLIIPRVGCTNSQTLSWLELTARSLSSTAFAPQVRGSSGVPGWSEQRWKQTFWLYPELDRGTFVPDSQRSYNHRATLLLILETWFQFTWFLLSMNSSQSATNKVLVRDPSTCLLDRQFQFWMSEKFLSRFCGRAFLQAFFSIDDSKYCNISTFFIKIVLVL